MEIMDKDGTKMIATIFSEMMQTHLDRMIVGNVYELCQGILKRNNGKFGKPTASESKSSSAAAVASDNKSDICFVFDKYTSVKLIDDDHSIPTLEKVCSAEYAKVTFSNLISIADMDQGCHVNLVAMIVKLGPVDTIDLKNGS